MSSILNSISSGDLLVLNRPREFPVKEDSILDVLQNPEIEFKINPRQSSESSNFEVDFSKLLNSSFTKQSSKLDVNNNSIMELLQNTNDVDISIFNTCRCSSKTPDIIIEDSSKTCDCESVPIQDLLENSEIECNTCPQIENNLNDVNTGFGANNDLHYECPCNPPKLNTPLYKENYFGEFETEALKAAARHALGLYNKDDVVAMSLLTTKEEMPDLQQLFNASIKLMRQGDLFFTPIVSFASTYDFEGVTLELRFKELITRLQNQLKEINKINSVSVTDNIESLGDIKIFLGGFSKKETLHQTLETMDLQMLRFEMIEQI